MEKLKVYKGYIILGILVALGIIYFSCGIVQNGESGIFVRWGEIKGEAVSEGLYFFNPIGTELVRYNVKNQIITLHTEQYTKDIQQAQVYLAVTYNLQRNKIKELHRGTGEQYEEIIINPAILGVTKDVMGKWEAVEFVSHRGEATKLMGDNLTQKLLPYGISVVQIEILDIAFSEEFEKAVEDKQVAEQEAIKEKNNTQRIKEIANQEVVKAEAEAKAKIVYANAEAEAIKAKSTAEAQAIELKGKALSENEALIKYEWATKWNGVLPTHTLGNSVVPFIKVDE